jgi:hypothetical protein
MSSPTVLTIFSVVFMLLGIYNIFVGLRRTREARERGYQIVWYKQINLLTGIEYVLLALVFLMSLSIRNGLIPPGLSVITIPFFVVVLAITAVMAFMVMRQAFINSRRPRARTSSQSNGTNQVVDASIDESSPELRTAQKERRRERRRNAAAARRRRAGKA